MFYPQRYEVSAYVIPYDHYHAQGIRGVIFDVDNTLVPHDAPADDQAREPVSYTHLLTACSGSAKETTAAETAAQTAAETTAADAGTETTEAGANAEDTTAAADLQKIIVGASPAPHAEILDLSLIHICSWSKEVVNWTQSDVNNNFIAGNLAMQQNGPWQIPGITKDAPDLKYGVTVLPKKDAAGGQATSILGGENMGVVAKDDTAGAVAFLKYYDQTDVMVEAMKQYGSFPPKTEAAKDPYWTEDPIQAEFITQLETSIPRGPSASWPSYSSCLLYTSRCV